MPARARVTVGSPCPSCECCDVAVEETADGTGEGENGVMCGEWEEGGREAGDQNRSRRPREGQGDERSSHEAHSYQVQPVS